jgi:transcriptional regulator with PAS, ATPase and Fis domain
MKDLPVSLICVLDQIPIGVCIIGRDRGIVFMNRALEALTGFSTEQCAGLPCSHVLRFNKCLENCPVDRDESRERCVLEGDIINQENQKIPVRVTFASLIDESGEISAYVETIDDLRQARVIDPARINPFSSGRIVGRCPQMEKILQFLPVIAQSEAPVVITGQIGTGKDLLAEELHHASLRANSPFITFHCGALPDSLAESELFGVAKDTFTGVVKKPGKFRLAHKGTLYIAEVGDLAPLLQTKLLNSLDEKIIYPIGSAKSVPVDVRIIAATSRDLGQMVQDGTFRSELYFRLNALSLHLPPLKERGEDRRLLMDHFMRAHASLLNKPVTGFSDACLEKLLEYGYPGNILELKHIVEYAVSLCRTEQIELRDLPAYLTEDFAGLDAKSPVSAEQPPPKGGAGRQGDWSALEHQMIMDALLEANGRRGKAARLLGWGRSTLWRKMKHYRIGFE